jgi:hypothetical protein
MMREIRFRLIISQDLGSNQPNNCHSNAPFFFATPEVEVVVVVVEEEEDHHPTRNKHFFYPNRSEIRDGRSLFPFSFPLTFLLELSNSAESLGIYPMWKQPAAFSIICPYQNAPIKIRCSLARQLVFLLGFRSIESILLGQHAWVTPMSDFRIRYGCLGTIVVS